MALIVDGVSKRFDSTPVLDGVSFTARDGEFVCLLGPNGSGKTTILRLIAGLDPITSGSILLDDQPASESRLGIGYVFQQNALLPWLTVRENIGYGLEIARAGRAQRDEQVGRYLEMMGLGDFADHFPRQLSGGMQQKVGIARALAIEPKVILMDEPFAALDAQTRNVLQKELLEIWAKTGKTVVFVTHSVDEAVFLGDRVVMLSERPSVVRECVIVDLPRPRDRTCSQFNAVRRTVLELLGEELGQEEPLPLRRARDLYAHIPEII